MKTSDFLFELPRELIAQTPAIKRSDSRLLIYNRQTSKTEHRFFRDIPEYFEPGDLLILNSSGVIPARLHTVDDNGEPLKNEIFFIKSINVSKFEAIVKPGKKFKPGRIHKLPGGFQAKVESIKDDGLRIFELADGANSLEVFTKYGEMPLPPYITSRESEPERYQTIYRKEYGSVAAPTAGLHFDQSVFNALEAKGVKKADIVLHVGMGTFKPIETEDLENHKMHEECFCITEETARLFKETKDAGKKIWACGTTTIRTLESAIQEDGTLKTGWQTTDCFIKPGYRFKAADHMITNFHLPASTLIVLVSAFAGRENILRLYNEAVALKYRFFSFGDSMLLI